MNHGGARPNCIGGDPAMFHRARKALRLVPAPVVLDLCARGKWPELTVPGTRDPIRLMLDGFEAHKLAEGIAEGLGASLYIQGKPDPTSHAIAKADYRRRMREQEDETDD